MASTDAADDLIRSGGKGRFESFRVPPLAARLEHFRTQHLHESHPIAPAPHDLVVGVSDLEVVALATGELEHDVFGALIPEY